jgi:SAM-dependent methyltransferase
MSLPADPSLELRRSVLNWWREQRSRQGVGASLGKLMAELWGFVLDSTPEQRRRRYGDMEYDWDHHVDTTSATVSWRDRLLGIFHSPYQPTEPALFHEMMQALSTDFTGFTFIDLGSGKGRTLLMAADYPFRRIVGVELLPELHRVASENLQKYASKSQRCFALETRCEDASEFDFAAEPTVIYLFNPLPEMGLARVIGNLERSLHEHPRKVFVLYHNPLLEHVVAANRALKRTGGTHQYLVYESVEECD